MSSPYPLLLSLLAVLPGSGCGPSVPADGGDPPLPECTAELDGVLEAAELPLALGIEVRYTRNAVDVPASFDVGGDVGSDGAALWDFSDGPADVGATFAILDPADTPCAELFDDASYAAPLLVETPDLLGCFRRTVFDDGTGELAMLGAVSDHGVAAAALTRWEYDEPLVLYRLPMQVGDAWEQTVSYRSAVAFGVPDQGVEHYRVEVDRLGSARIPGGIEVADALRVRVDLEQTLAVSVGEHVRTVHQLQWVRPCFGELGRAVSPDPSFDLLDEIRRYYP